MEQIRKKAPKRSICWIFSLVVNLECFLSGFLKKKNTTAIAHPPTGKLIQKHQRQVSLSVKAPPKMGPMTDEMPNILLSRPI